MLKTKTEDCSKCGYDRPVWKRENKLPVCQYCASKSNKIKQVTPKTAEKQKARRTKLNIYFDYHIGICERSEESNTPIPNPGRINICHIFPKRLYKSVEDNLDNVVYLEIQEHVRFDYLLDTFNFKQLEKEFTNSWGIVCKRVRKLLPLIKEQKKLKIKFEEYFNL